MLVHLFMFIRDYLLRYLSVNTKCSIFKVAFVAFVKSLSLGNLTEAFRLLR